jgi:acetyl/propionyl-CoA carboxylase alpha subunit
MSRKILIANRGALRLVRAVRDLRIAGMAVFADDDTQAPHVRHADAAAALGASGPVAYLDLERLLAIAREHGCLCGASRLRLPGRTRGFRAGVRAGVHRLRCPTPEQLALSGDKVRARALAGQCGVPVLPGSAGAVDLPQAQALFEARAATP